MKLELELHSPLTPSQQRVLRSRKEHLLIQGPAGTAKSYTAIARGLIKLANKEADRIIIIRSPVEIRKIGHLPGEADEKIEPYAVPYIELFDEISPKMRYKELYSKRLVEFEPTTFLRGRTFHDAIVIADEFQNLSGHELETIITRLGRNSQLMVVGDPEGQTDLPRHEQGEWRDVIEAFASMESVDTVTFPVSEIVRSEFVQAYYTAKQAVQDGRALPAQLFGRPAPSRAAA